VGAFVLKRASHSHISLSDTTDHSCGLRSALLAPDGEKCSRFLFHTLTAALRALDLFFVLLQGENQFEGLVAIVANVVIHGHGNLPLEIADEVRGYSTAESCGQGKFSVPGSQFSENQIKCRFGFAEN
jgi:hypothetical protein